MKNRQICLCAVLALLLCLVCACAMAEEDFSGIAGEWYTEEISMNITEDGRFTIYWNDVDWTGSLKTDWYTEDGEEYVTYRMVLDQPGLARSEDLELRPSLSYPGKMTFIEGGSHYEFFYNVPVYVMDTEGEDLACYEPYTYIDASHGNEPAITMMFTFLRPVLDVAVMGIFDQTIGSDGELYYNADTIEWWPELDSQNRIVVKRVFDGDLPNLVISFAMEDGTGYDFAVDISGENGELYLWRLLPSMG